MKALTVCQPYAWLLSTPEKPIENRTWPTSYRGPLLIHAGRSRAWMEPGDDDVYPSLQFGAVIALRNLVACLNIEHVDSWPDEYRHLGEHRHANGPWCWICDDDIRRIDPPIFCKGAQGLWVPSPELVQQVNERLGQTQEATA